MTGSFSAEASSQACSSNRIIDVAKIGVREFPLLS